MDYLLNYKVCSVSFLVTLFVLNLIINGLPSKLKKRLKSDAMVEEKVLNLIINGLPSKLVWDNLNSSNTIFLCFKPYYKWITF